MRESFDSANKIFAIRTCTVNANFNYSRYFKTKAETMHALFHLRDVTFEIGVRLIFCQLKFVFALGLKEEERKGFLHALIHLSSVQVNMYPLNSYNRYPLYSYNRHPMNSYNRYLVNSYNRYPLYSYNRYPLYSYYVLGAQLEALDTETSEPTVCPAPGLLIQ